MALVEPQSTATCSIGVRGAFESRGSHEPASTTVGGASLPAEREPAAPAARASRLRTLVATVRSSVWTPVLTRALGVLLGMLGLAAIGAWATVKGAPGHAVTAVAESAAPDGKLERAALVPVAASAAPSSSPESGGGAANPKPSPAVTTDGKVILNLATVEDLRRLPGIGKKRAESIVALREKLGGRFRKVSDLLRIRGMGVRRLKQLTPLVVLDPPAPAPPSSSSLPAPRPGG